VNFTTSILDVIPGDRTILIERGRDGSRREWGAAEVCDRSARLAGTLISRGVSRGDTVMTLIGNRSEWVFAMAACFRMGAVVLPCNEQVRSGELAMRISLTKPAVILVDERNIPELERAHPSCPVLSVPDESLFDGPPAPVVDLSQDDPCLITFTSGSTGNPKGVLHTQRYLGGQSLQAENWIAARPGDLVWCTASSGWSKSARNAFIAPWLCGAAALLHDARFDPRERVEIIAEERVSVLCMTPTEYRAVVKRGAPSRFDHLRETIAAGEALNGEALEAWHSVTGLWIRDGYGQTESGQITANRPGVAPKANSMGQPLPGVRLRIEDGELVVHPSSVPTFFCGYVGEPPISRDRAWHTGDLVHQDDEGFLYFEGRADDIIISSGYRIGPGEVETALLDHPAVMDAAAVAAPDSERGSVVRAIVVLDVGWSPSTALVSELQAHVKQHTAPYKYPRVIDFARALPRTSNGKLQRAALVSRSYETVEVT
jgi:acyl-coenzyme A synthetase/AMP-(fatty) acid ligase